MKSRTILIGYSLILGYTIGPLFVVALAHTAAWLAGSTISGTAIHPTFAFGHDIGPLLYSAVAFAFLSIITFPTGGMMLIGFTIAVVVANRNCDSASKKNA